MLNNGRKGLPGIWAEREPKLPIGGDYTSLTLMSLLSHQDNALAPPGDYGAPRRGASA